MPADFHFVARLCSMCGKPLLLKNNRDIIRKRYCSRSCLFHATKPYQFAQLVIEETKKKMCKPHRLTEKLMEAQKIRGLAHRGEHSHWWRGGITNSTHLRVNRPSWKTLTKTIKLRDGNRCQMCGASQQLCVHHIRPYRESQDDSPNNLITLCQSCHGKSESRLGAGSYECFI